MAGRPASRGGGLTGLHYGLIAFVIVSVAALAGFIMQLTQNKKLQDEADRLSKLVDEDYGRPPQFYLGEARASRGSTAFAVMERYLKDYGTLVSGNSDAVYPAVAAQAERAI
ncbi:MAG: hypothetical protein JXO22_16120, partial [Phycisphaerae bacterium]|nr:hypothetical protein [Phycisphaerae bacterium]